MIENYLELCTKLKINFEQLLICLIIQRRNKIENDFSLRHEFAGKIINYTHTFKEFSLEDINYLLKKNFIDFKENEESRELKREHAIYLDSFKVTPLFIDHLENIIDVYWNEIFDIYPQHLLIQGTPIYSKNLTDEDNLKNKYYEIIKGKEENHFIIKNYILSLKRKNNNKALVKLENFIKFQARDLLRDNESIQERDLIDEG